MGRIERSHSAVAGSFTFGQVVVVMASLLPHVGFPGMSAPREGSPCIVGGGG